MNTRSLKSQNIKWLWAVVVLDALLVLAIAGPPPALNFELTKYDWARASLGALTPVIVMLISSLVTADVKAVLVFWRVRDVLPGHRAFSVYAKTDSRVDVVALEKSVGPFPSSPREQNTKWYGLYKAVENDVRVTDAHRGYLLFRDIAAMSMLLMFVAIYALLFVGMNKTRLLLVTSLFIFQYALAVLAARNNGVRLVTNVLALHGTH